MVRSCDKKRGRKLHETNCDGRSQRKPESRTRDRRSDGETLYIQQDTKSLQLKKDHTGDRKKWRLQGSQWLTLPWEGLIQAGRRYILNAGIVHIRGIDLFIPPALTCPDKQC